MTRILLVRHGATDWSESGRHTGRTDVALNADGEAEAEAFRGILQSCLGGVSPPPLVLTSPMQRARETAALAGFAAAVPDPDLVEMNYGDCEGRTTAEIRVGRPGWTVWDGCTGGETPDDVGLRVDRVLDRIRGVDGTTVLFGHGHCLRILVARWLELAPIEGRRFALATGTCSMLGYEREVPVLECFNWWSR